MNNGWIYRERVDASGVGQTVLDYYTQRYRHSSRADWLQRIQAGQITLDQAPATPEKILTLAQQLAYHRLPWCEPDVSLDIRKIYEDDDLWAVSKPAGLPVLPGSGFLNHTLLKQWQYRYPYECPVPIHRLGRGTSGLMLIARSHQARSVLSQQLRDRQIIKVYRALVGQWDLGDRLTITQPIGKIAHPTLGYVYGAASQGQVAHSECRMLGSRGETTLLEVTITTGRPHQIRIHLASVGYPLLGDPLYRAGGDCVLPKTIGDRAPVPGDCGYHLHAHRLLFRHPTMGNTLELECEPPARLCLTNGAD